MKSAPGIRRVFSCLVLALLAVGTAGAVDGADDAGLDPRDRSLRPHQRLEALLAKCRERQAQVATLEADFTQLKTSAMLLEPSEARGVFSYSAPDRVRWEYQKPEPISLLISGDRMTTWYRDLETAETVHIGKKSQRILDFLGAGSDLDRLLEYFSVSLMVPESQTAPFRLELDPLFSQVRKRLQGMKIWIDPELYLPTALRYVEADGDVTEYRFERLRINGELPAERFELELPEKVEHRIVEIEGRPTSR